MSDRFKYSIYLTEKVTLAEVKGWLEYERFLPAIIENSLNSFSFEGILNDLRRNYPFVIPWQSKRRFRKMIVKTVRSALDELEKEGKVARGPYSQFHWNSVEFAKAEAEKKVEKENKEREVEKIIKLGKRLGIATTHRFYGNSLSLDQSQMLAIAEFLDAHGFQMPENLREEVQDENASET